MTKDHAAIAAAQSQHYHISREVFRETDQQLVKWGVQDHPMGTGPTLTFTHLPVGSHYLHAVDFEEWARDRTDDSAKRGDVTYEKILTEEFAEAIAEDDPVKLEAELIQVAAVAVSMIAASRRARGA